jgi:hypothetical protein
LPIGEAMRLPATEIVATGMTPKKTVEAEVSDR